MWLRDQGQEEQTGLDTGFFNRLFIKHPLRAPLIGMSVAIVIFIVAFSTGLWRLAMPGVIITIFCLPLLIIGVLRRMLNTKSRSL